MIKHWVEHYMSQPTQSCRSRNDYVTPGTLPSVSVVTVSVVTFFANFSSKLQNATKHMAGKWSVEQMHTHTNTICWTEPPKVYQIAENKCSVVTGQNVPHWFSDFGTSLLQNDERLLLTVQPQGRGMLSLCPIKNAEVWLKPDSTYVVKLSVFRLWHVKCGTAFFEWSFVI